MEEQPDKPIGFVALKSTGEFYLKRGEVDKTKALYLFTSLKYPASLVGSQVSVKSGSLSYGFSGTKSLSEAYLTSVSRYLQKKDYKKAIAQLQALIKETPAGQEAAVAQEWLAALYLNIKKPKPAARIYQTLLSQYCAAELKTEDKEVRKIYQKANALFARGRWNKAISLFKKIAEQHPESSYAPPSLLTIGIIEEKFQGKEGRSDIAYQEIINTYPKTYAARLSLQRLTEKYRPNQKEESENIRILKEIAEQHPDTKVGTEARYKLADEYYLTGDLPSAFIEYQKALIQDPTHPSAPQSLKKIAQFYYDKGRFDLAGMEYEELLNKYYPKDKGKPTYANEETEPSEIEYLTALCKTKDKDYRPAKEDLAKASYWEGYSLYREGKRDEAVNVLQKTARKYSDLEEGAKAQYLIGLIYTSENKTDQAEESFQRLKEGFPKSLHALRMATKEEEKIVQQVKSWDKPENYQKTIAHYEKIKKEGNIDIDTLLDVGLVYIRLRRFNDAREVCQRIITGSYPRSEKMVQAQFMMGEIYYEENDYGKAITEWQKLMDYYPQSESLVADAHYRVGLCYNMQGNPQKAREQFEILLKAGGGKTAPAYLSYLVAESYQKENNFPLAIAMYQKTMGNYPSTYWAYRSQLAIGLIYFQIPNYDKAIKELSKIVDAKIYNERRKSWESFSESPTAQYYIIQCYDKLRNEIKVREETRKLKEEFPESHYVKMLEEEGKNAERQKTEEIITSYKEATQKYSSKELSASAQFKIAEKYYSLENYSQAMNEYKKVLENYPDTDYALKAFRKRVEYYFGKKEYLTGLEDYQRIANKFGIQKETEPIINDAKRNKDYLKAKEKCDDIINLALKLESDQIVKNLKKIIIEENSDSKEAIEASYKLAQRYGTLGAPQSAYLEYQRIIDKYPNSPYLIPSLYQTASYYEKTNDYKRAKEDYLKILKERIKTADNSPILKVKLNAFSERAKTVQTTTDLRGIIKECETLVQQEVKNKERLNMDRMVTLYRGILERDPKSKLAPKAQYELAERYLALGEREEALWAYNKVLENYPKSAYVSAANERIKQLKQISGII
ncbi:MAG: tetratricopeptide repeat protein [Candidatus Ratteibacteria bacterium]